LQFGCSPYPLLELQQLKNIFQRICCWS